MLAFVAIALVATLGIEASTRSTRAASASLGADSTSITAPKTRILRDNEVSHAGPADDDALRPHYFARLGAAAATSALDDEIATRRAEVAQATRRFQAAISSPETAFLDARSDVMSKRKAFMRARAITANATKSFKAFPLTPSPEKASAYEAMRAAKMDGKAKHETWMDARSTFIAARKAFFSARAAAAKSTGLNRAKYFVKKAMKAKEAAEAEKATPAPTPAASPEVAQTPAAASPEAAQTPAAAFEAAQTPAAAPTAAPEVAPAPPAAPEGEAELEEEEATATPSDADAASSDASDASAPVAPAAKATEALAEDISSGSDFDAAAMEPKSEPAAPHAHSSQTCEGGFSPFCTGKEFDEKYGNDVLAAKWTGETLDNDGDASNGAVRVLKGKAKTFQDWLAMGSNANLFNNSMCHDDMLDCCLINTTGFEKKRGNPNTPDKLTSCAVPYNDDIINITIGERRTIRLPCSPCNPNDCVPLSGYVIATAETTVVHQIGICGGGKNGNDRYGCLHVDGIDEGPSTWTAVAYYGYDSPGGRDANKAGKCSIAGPMSASALPGFDARFGGGLDHHFSDHDEYSGNYTENNANDCCANAVSFSFNIVPPNLTAAAPYSKYEAMNPVFSHKPKNRLIKGRARLGNGVDLQTCDAISGGLRTALAKLVSSFDRWNKGKIKRTYATLADVYVECVPAKGSVNSASVDTTTALSFGGPSVSTIVEFEIYFSQYYEHLATEGFKMAVKLNDGNSHHDYNPTGFVNEVASNYWLEHHVREALEGSNAPPMDYMKMTLDEWQLYRGSNCKRDEFPNGHCVFTKTEGAASDASAPSFEPLNGRRTKVPPGLDAGLAPEDAVALNMHNDFRAAAGLRYLTWNATLAKHAREYAETLCESGITDHDIPLLSRLNEGENLYSFAHQTMLAGRTNAQMASTFTEGWYRELEYYNYGPNGARCTLRDDYVAPLTADSWKHYFGSDPMHMGALSSNIGNGWKVGHMTQVMRHSAHQLGCFTTQCSGFGRAFEKSPSYRWIGVCRYKNDFDYASAPVFKGKTFEDGGKGYPFSPRAAASIRLLLETFADRSDDESLCHKSCSGTPNEAYWNALDATVELEEAPEAGWTPPPRNASGSMCTRKQFPDVYEPR